MEKFNIRWSDLDANRHLANYSFVNLMSQARLNFIRQSGVTQKVLEEYDLGPVAFYENIYYFREVSPDEPIYISVELKGYSEDGTFFEFVHNIYDQHGRNMATCEMMGAWIDLETRRLTVLPETISKRFENLKKSEDFKFLTKEDTRKHGIKPCDINPERLEKVALV